VKSKSKYKPNMKDQRILDLEVMAFLVNSNFDCSFVESRAFQQFIAVTNPEYNIKSAQTM
jgi:hypothetical protein